MVRMNLWWTTLLVSFLVTFPVAAEESEQTPTMDGLIQGEMPWEQAFDAAMLAGRDHYNAEERREAEEAFVQAVQILPDQPAPYRNLARNYNLMGNYAEATAFYDQYLRMAPDAQDREIIERERRGAAMRAGEERWREPASQRMSLRALERELEVGRALTPGGGGAWDLYQALLESGYAAPRLRELRNGLIQILVDEVEAHWEANDGFLPVLSEQDWALQQQRLSALKDLVRSQQGLEFVHRRMALVEAVEQILGEPGDEIVDMTRKAVEKNADLSFAPWYLVVALERVGRAEEALQTLDDLLATEVLDGQTRRRAQVIRAQLISQVGDVEEAVQVYRSVLGR